MKERIEGFDLIRAIAALTVVIYHYACSCSEMVNWSQFNFFYRHANGNWGEITSVSMFFMLSGAVLYYNYSNVKELKLKSFYFARWKSIFPMFLITWIYLFYRNVLSCGKIFYSGNPMYILLTLTGLDGYFLYLHPNYYIIGEWFLGALIIIYAIYPILLIMIKRNKMINSAIILLLYCMVIISNVFQILDTRNLITCIFSFWIGMMFIDIREKLKGTIVTIISFSLSVILIFIPLRLENVISMNILSFCLFIFLYNISKYIYKIKPLKVVIMYTSKISYAIFLIQHIVIVQVVSFLANRNLNLVKEFAVLGLIITLIYIFATVIFQLNKSIVNSSIFKKIESFFNTEIRNQ